MKKRILSILCAMVLLLTACGQKPAPEQEQEKGFTLLATTYPVYLFAKAVTGDVEGVEVQRLNTGSVSCLHDYTLSVGDMKMIEGADLIAINGVGLEEFMEDALAASKAKVVDCSQGVELLENPHHHHEEGDDHDHGHYDPHIWMDLENAVTMLQNLSAALVEADPDHAGAYEENTAAAQALLGNYADTLEDQLALCPVKDLDLITFHDGFQYFAEAFDLNLLASIEEEAGSEASAKEINEITALVKERNIPIIFTEKNGSDATAQAIARETGCAVGQLNMLMSGDSDSLEGYLEGMADNVIAVVNGFAGKEVIQKG